jgi:hypothetical protein
MKRTYLVAWIAALIAAFVVGFVIGSKHGPVPPLAKFDLQVYFDGGYMFDFSQADTVDVYALRKANFPMKVQVMTTQGSTPMDMTGFALSLLPDGASPKPAKPDLPPLDANQTGCKDSDQKNPNNLLFMPSLTEVATHEHAKIKSPIDAATVLHLTGGGAITFQQLGGCVQFQDAQGKEWKPKRSMVSGIGGVLYEWPSVSGTSLSLQWKPLPGTTGSGSSLLAMPDPSGIVQIRVSTFPPSDPPPGQPPFEITHFKDHFADAFDNLDLKKFKLIWLGTYLDSPGIDCPFGGS